MNDQNFLFETEFQPLYGQLRAEATKYANANDVDDLVQETLMRAWQRLSQFTPGTSALAWSRVIMRNIAYDRSRRKAARATEVYSDSDGFLDQPASILTEDVAFADHGFESVLELLDGIDAGKARALFLSDVMGLSNIEIAELEAVPIGTVASRKTRGRNELREALAS